MAEPWMPLPAEGPPEEEVTRIVLKAYEYVHGYPLRSDWSLPLRTVMLDVL